MFNSAYLARAAAGRVSLCLVGAAAQQPSRSKLGCTASGITGLLLPHAVYSRHRRAPPGRHVIVQNNTKLSRQVSALAPCMPECRVLLVPYLCTAGGRYLADIWMYNLNKLAWTAPSPSDPAAAQPSGGEGSPLLAVSGPPPAAGWSVTPLQDNKLLVMGGHTKVGKVRLIGGCWGTRGTLCSACSVL